MSEDKPKEESLRAGQFWITGTVESYGPVTRGTYTANYLRVFVKNERNPKYPDTYFIKVLDKAAEKLTANPGDQVEVTVYASSRLNKAGDGAFADFTLAYCKVLKESAVQGTESGTREVDAPKFDDGGSSPF